MKSLNVTHSDNNIILVMSKVVYGQALYRITNAGSGHERYQKDFPKEKTVIGMTEQESCAQHIVDVFWKQHAKYGFDKVEFIAQFCMTNGHTLEFSGERAKSLWDTYKAHVFAKEKKHENKRTDNKGNDISGGELSEVSKQGCEGGNKKLHS